MNGTVSRAEVPSLPDPDVRRVADGLWVWDESRVDPEVGGNKVRKLQHLLPEATAAGATALATAGGTGSNHVLATAVLGARVGLPVHAVLFPQPLRPDVRATRARLGEVCASVREVSTPLGAVWTSRRVPGAWWIPPGGTSPTGSLGWRDAAAGGARRVLRGELPRPDRVVVAVGTGGTAAGLLAGFAVAGLATEVVGARVVARWATGRRRITALARALAPGVRLPPLRVVDAVGRGYGEVDDAALAAFAHGRAAGLSLELTYTAKAYDVALAARRDGGCTWFVATAGR